MNSLELIARARPAAGPAAWTLLVFYHSPGTRLRPLRKAAKIDEIAGFIGEEVAVPACPHRKAPSYVPVGWIVYGCVK